MLAIVSDYGDIDFSRRSENLFSRFYARLRDNDKQRWRFEFRVSRLRGFVSAMRMKARTPVKNWRSGNVRSGRGRFLSTIEFRIARNFLLFSRSRFRIRFPFREERKQNLQT